MIFASFYNVVYFDKINYHVVFQLIVSSESGFMCFEVRYKSENVISAKVGRLSRNQEEACDRQLFFDASIQSTTLISKLLLLI